MKQAIAANYLGILDKCLKQHGINDFLKHIDIKPARLNDPAAFLTEQELTVFIKKAYEISELPYLGLLFGECLSIVNHGFLGYAMMTSPTLGAAIRVLLSYLTTRTALLCGQLCGNASGKTFVEFKLLTNDPLINRFLTEMAMVHLTKIRGFLLNITSPCLRIELSYPEPVYSEYYRQILSTQIKFNAKKNRVMLLSTELESPINFADDASYQQATLQLQAMIEHLTKENDLPSRIKALLYTQDLSQLSMQQIASQLCLSVRTLRRHLQLHQTTYQSLFDEVRQHKAEELLANSQHSITEISFLLGFRDVSNFTKSFKRWSQLTPTQYRLRFR